MSGGPDGDSSRADSGCSDDQICFGMETELAGLLVTEKEDKVPAFVALGTDEMRKEIRTQCDPGLGRSRQGSDRGELVLSERLGRYWVIEET